MWAVHRFRATITAAPNFAYELCGNRLDDAAIEGLDLSSLRWVFNGAEPVSVETVTRFAARYAAHGLNARAIAPVYGLAECALDLTFPPAPRGALIDSIDRDALMKTSRAVPVSASDPRAHRLVACGHLLPGYAARITGPEGEVLEERQVGRIYFQGPSATRGYNRNPTATKALFDGPWLDTGDIGYLAAGDLYVTGRAKDMIIRGGHNIYPNELEEAIGALPGVRKGCVAVLGIADAPRATERVIVLAESRETNPATREQLKVQINRLTANTLGGPADDVVIVPPHTVLKTSSGKIRRAATRELYLRAIAHLPQRAVWLQVCRLVAQNALARGKSIVAHTLLLTFALWAWTAFLVVAVLGIAVVLLLPSIRACRAAAHLLARTLAAAIGVRIDVAGGERIPRDRAYVLVANHLSYIDAIVLAAVLPAHVGFVAKGEFRRQWLMRRVLEAVGAPFAERFDAAKGIEDTRTIEQVARRGESLVFFPEGTFASDPRLQTFRMGAFVIAAGNALPVVPVAILGTRSILPPDGWTPKPGRVRVMIGDPIVAHGKEWAHAVQLREAAWTWIKMAREAHSSGA